MTDADPDFLMSETVAERRRLIELAAAFTGDQWAAPSLCAGWRVREVVAHLTMPYRHRPTGYLWGMFRHGFRFNRFADRDACTTTATRSDSDLLDLWRAHSDDRWQPPGGGPAGSLSHELIHGLDITEPLGLPSAPPDRLALMLRHTGPRNVAYFGVDLSGLRLEADDADAAVGDGTVVRLPVRQLVLVVTGRRTLDEAQEAA